VKGSRARFYGRPKKAASELQTVGVFTGRCAHLQVVELEVALMHRLAAASVLTLHVEGEAARRCSTVDAAHRTRRKRPRPNPIATRIRLALPAWRAPLSWMGCSGSLHQWRMPRACALGADRS
jgi:hypothetical protein